MREAATPHRAEEPVRPGISVVVPLYNKAPYIARCLESIRRQTWTNFEVVVIDDGSTDEGGTIAASFGDSRLRAIRQDNRGEGAARNRGIAEARADLIAFLDADDTWEPLFLEAIAALAEKYPSAGLFATGYRRCYGMGPDAAVTVRAPAGAGTHIIRDYFRAVREGDFVTSSSCAVPRSVLDRVGLFAEGEPIGADRDLWARICIDRSIAYDTRVLAVYHSEAEGRAFQLWGAIRRYPLAVRSLRALIAAGGLTRSQVYRAQAYSDWLVLKYAHQITYDRDRNALTQLLQTEKFGTLRYRLQASLLQCLIAFLPLRVVAALKIRSAIFLQQMRQIRSLGGLFRISDVWRGRTVIRYSAPPKEPDLEPVRNATNTGT